MSLTEEEAGGRRSAARYPWGVHSPAARQRQLADVQARLLDEEREIEEKYAAARKGLLERKRKLQSDQAALKRVLEAQAAAELERIATDLVSALKKGGGNV